ncbi:hypothetical protein EDD34_1279 [Myceligenerans xiligouense]|uniref:Uncharacterized protein n=2 Tax=Myceligenerans xiligouense TaxID=253184 RepID=A0A3N4Z5Z2_9MICO|nr:hypothetical protein EDD34_1279 [Myceligenerans xiligouense]
MRLPDAVRTALREHGTDRPLARTELDDGGWAFASRTTLIVTSGGGEVTVDREWCDVDRATADPETGTITVEWVDGGAPLVLRLAPKGRASFPQALRERVQWSVVHAAPVNLPDGRSARVAVRRRANGDMFSQVVGGADLDLSDPVVAAAVDAAESRARSAVGLPM